MTRYTGEYDSAFLVQNGDLLIGMDGEFNSVIWAGGPALLNQRVSKLHSFKGCLKEYVALLIPKKLQEIEDGTYAVTVKHISGKQISAIEIPLPPLEVQKEIVAEIEGYQAVIDGARAVLDHYRPHIPIDPAWPLVPIVEVARVKNGFAFKSDEYVSEGLRVMRIKNVQKGRVIDDDPKFMDASRAEEFSAFTLKGGDILMSLTGNVGRVGRLEIEHEPAVLNQRVAHIEIKPGRAILPEFLFAILNADKFEEDAIKAATGVAQANLSSNWVNEYPIPLPPLATQQAIVAEIEAEQKLVAANRELIARFEKKIQATLARIWGEETPAAPAR